MKVMPLVIKDVESINNLHKCPQKVIVNIQVTEVSSFFLLLCLTMLVLAIDDTLLVLSVSCLLTFRFSAIVTLGLNLAGYNQ